MAVAGGLGAATAPAAAEPAEPTPVVAEDRGGCASCHAGIAREWAASAHRRSGTDSAYLRAVAQEPLPFCRACHVPSGDASRETPASVAERGIGCVDCHVGVRADHARGVALPKAKACASCHEFTFPSGKGLMQRTASEHAKSALSSTSCESCHMPKAGKHQDHGFLVDDAMLARALVADVARVGASRVAVRLRPGEVGHAMPTGDLFRRLEVRAAVTDEHGETLGSATRFLARKLRSERVSDGVFVKVDGKDDRVGAPDLESCFELDLGVAAASRPIALTIAHQRVQEPRGRERDALVNESRVVFHAILPATGGEGRPCK